MHTNTPLRSGYDFYEIRISRLLLDSDNLPPLQVYVSSDNGSGSDGVDLSMLRLAYLIWPRLWGSILLMVDFGFVLRNALLWLGLFCRGTG
jgi:hypothetical protein